MIPANTAETARTWNCDGSQIPTVGDRSHALASATYAFRAWQRPADRKYEEARPGSECHVRPFRLVRSPILAPRSGSLSTLAIPRLDVALQLEAQDAAAAAVVACDPSLNILSSRQESRIQGDLPSDIESNGTLGAGLSKGQKSIHNQFIMGATDWTFWDDQDVFAAISPLNLSMVTNVPMSTPSATFAGDFSASIYPATDPVSPAPGHSILIAPHPQPTSLSVSTSQHHIEARIPCGFPGCNSTFRRVGDCRRHMGKHQAPTFRCITVDCDKTFYRVDKVRDHLRQGHGILL
ncbi:hypothetical protein EK21DRAFT_113952 [Setomelanomma holmii]|uniref:C2H2-type domain-containing protein n=1 Tax=Setomelanomma holmii TaxID=210430 RepID=A0A9P4H688_9PLEO|nr:hypothetical protein EK21DRAFT_113952 [Setomelanomma holmii]